MLPWNVDIFLQSSFFLETDIYQWEECDGRIPAACTPRKLSSKLLETSCFECSCSLRSIRIKSFFKCGNSKCTFGCHFAALHCHIMVQCDSYDGPSHCMLVWCQPACLPFICTEKPSTGSTGQLDRLTAQSWHVNVVFFPSFLPHYTCMLWHLGAFLNRNEKAIKI